MIFFTLPRNIFLHYQQGESEVKTVIKEIKFRGKCEYYVPAWEGSKTSGKQPDFCLKHRVVLCGKCVKSCKEQNTKSEVEEG